MIVKEKYKAVYIFILALPLPFWVVWDKIQLSHDRSQASNVRRNFMSYYYDYYYVGTPAWHTFLKLFILK